MTKGRLINASNRLPIQVRKHGGKAQASRSTGGLATALDAIWRNQQGVWIGWAGPAEGPQVEQLISKASGGRSHSLRTVALSEDEVAKFYAGFANEIVWPLFHDMPTRCNFDLEYWETYQCVNRKFALTVAETAEPEDFIWVHDYHLMLVAAYLREAHARNRLGFFLHIPFPAPDLFEKLPWGKCILRSLLDFDLLGFQTERDCNNFVACIQRLLPEVRTALWNTRFVIEGTRQSLAGTFPISIDFDEFSGHAARPEIAARAAEIRKDLNDHVLVLGVDRMDYTKGIPERLKAFRTLLHRFPELCRHIVMVQVVVPSREGIPDYKDLHHEIERLVGQINGEFTQPGWVPVYYMYRALGRDELLAYYRASDIALITPLKDGMNLVAKEFCAAQVDHRGVVIVSEFAGASQELRHGALLVNPNDIEGVAQAVHQACLMPKQEKRRRMQLLREIVKEHNVQRWAQSFMEAAFVLGPRDEPEDVSGIGCIQYTAEDSGRPETMIAAPQARDNVQEFPRSDSGPDRLWMARAND